MRKEYIKVFKNSLGINVNVQVQEVKTDASAKYYFSLVGDKFDTSTAVQLPRNFKDSRFEAKGYKLVGGCNASLFFGPIGADPNIYAVGIEKSRGIVNENDDASKDGVMALYLDANMIYIYYQKWVKDHLASYDGAQTAAFGLIESGKVNTAGSIENSGQFKARSGRAIIGKKLDGTVVIAACEAATGSNKGITGTEAVQLAQALGLHNAVCEDGGGSVFFRNSTGVVIDTTRKVKNTILVYEKVDLSVGDMVEVVGTFKITSITNEKAYLADLGIVDDISVLKKV